jgi:hypothetical protein
MGPGLVSRAPFQFGDSVLAGVQSLLIRRARNTGLKFLPFFGGHLQQYLLESTYINEVFCPNVTFANAFCVQVRHSKLEPDHGPQARANRNHCRNYRENTLTGQKSHKTEKK